MQNITNPFEVYTNKIHEFGRSDTMPENTSGYTNHMLSIQQQRLKKYRLCMTQHIRHCDEIYDGEDLVATQISDDEALVYGGYNREIEIFFGERRVYKSEKPVILQILQNLNNLKIDGLYCYDANIPKDKTKLQARSIGAIFAFLAAIAATIIGYKLTAVLDVYAIIAIGTIVFASILAGMAIGTLVGLIIKLLINIHWRRHKHKGWSLQKIIETTEIGSTNAIAEQKVLDVLYHLVFSDREEQLRYCDGTYNTDKFESFIEIESIDSIKKDKEILKDGKKYTKWIVKMKGICARGKRAFLEPLEFIVLTEHDQYIEDLVVVGIQYEKQKKH